MLADIRPALASDIDALLSIENNVFGSDRISRRAFRHHIGSPTAACLTASGAGVIMGYALILFRAGSATARLYSLAVSPSFENAGLGTQLLAASEDVANSRGCTRLRLEVHEENQRAISLYERSGYRRIGRQEGYYQHGATALRFEKQLGG